MKAIIIFLLSFGYYNAVAQNVGLDWVKTYGGSSVETGSILRNDSEGNLYVVGKFMGTVDFDPGLGIANETSNGGIDIYILKLDSNGNFLWVRTFGNASQDIVEHAQVDKTDNIIVTGRFFNSIDFDPGLSVDLKTSNGASDIYILKLDDMGNYVWAKTLGAAGHETSRGLSISSSNDVTIAGRFINTVDFDPGVGVANESALGVDIYILQLDATGNFNWVKTLQGPQNSSVQVNDIMYDRNDNLLMNASYKDSIDVDPGPGTQYLVDTVDPLQFNLFMLKLDPNGNYVWAQQFENVVGGSVGVSKLSCDSVGNYYLGGLFYGTVDFNFGTAVYNITTPKNASYILKVDSNGSFVWAKHMGGFSGISPEYESVFGIAIDAQSNVTLCGSFKGYEDFDPGPGVFYLGIPNQISHIHAYIMQLDNNGSLNWAKNIGEQPSAASANGIVLNTNGQYYVTGEFNDNTDFDFNSGVYNLTPQGDWDAFVLKINDCAHSATTDVINSCEPIVWIDGLTYSANNSTATHTLSSALGCDSVITLSFTLSTVDTSITKTADKLTANASGVSYQWLDCDNNFAALVGETNQSFTPSTNGSYAVIVNNGSCKDTSNCYSFVALSTDDFIKEAIVVFPNPSRGQVQIETDKPLTFRLYNQVGQLIMTKEFKGSQKTNSISIVGIAKGLYNYTLSDKSNHLSRGKLVLE
jgi:hypothetical protein